MGSTSVSVWGTKARLGATECGAKTALDAGATVTSVVEIIVDALCIAVLLVTSGAEYPVCPGIIGAVKTGADITFGGVATPGCEITAIDAHTTGGVNIVDTLTRPCCLGEGRDGLRIGAWVVTPSTGEPGSDGNVITTYVSRVFANLGDKGDFGDEILCLISAGAVKDNARALGGSLVLGKVAAWPTLATAASGITDGFTLSLDL